MNNPFPTISTRPTRRHDPREVLDPQRRLAVLALLRLGGSRRMAARQAGCAHTTIARTAARDAEFAAELGDAEAEAARDALRLPRGAEAEVKLGRAAAWIARHGCCRRPETDQSPTRQRVRRRPLSPALRALSDGGEAPMSLLEELLACRRAIEQAEAKRNGA